MTKLILLLSAFSFILIVMSNAIPLEQSPQFDVLIKNGRIIDGSGLASYNGDVGIIGQRIERIGNLANATAAKTIDASVMVVAPGFIDMLGKSETYLLIDPCGLSKMMMGGTAAITGEAKSIAPLNAIQF